MKTTWLVVLCSMAILGAGCKSKEPPKASNEMRQLTQRVQAFEARLGQMASALPGEDGPCPEGPLRSVIKRTQNRRVLFADIKSLKAAAHGKLDKESSPLTFLVSPALLERRGSAKLADEKAATEAAFAIVSLKKRYDFLAALDFTFKAPKVDGKRFHPGKLEGTLALFELGGGRPLCRASVFAASSLEAVKKPGQSLQEATDTDFQMQIRRALEETFARMTDELVLELG